MKVIFVIRLTNGSKIEKYKPLIYYRYKNSNDTWISIEMIFDIQSIINHLLLIKIYIDDFWCYSICDIFKTMNDECILL